MGLCEGGGGTRSQVWVAKRAWNSEFMAVRHSGYFEASVKLSGSSGMVTEESEQFGSWGRGQGTVPSVRTTGFKVWVRERVTIGWDGEAGGGKSGESGESGIELSVEGFDGESEIGERDLGSGLGIGRLGLGDGLGS